MSHNNAVQRFFGYILMAVGGLITLLSGGCTVVWLGFLAWNIVGGLINGSIFNPVNVNAVGATLGLTLIVSGLPIAIGVVLFVAGRRMVEVQRFFAYVWMAMGGLITVLCGTCTAIYLWSAVTSAGYSVEYGPGFGHFVGLVALVVGGLPTAFGVLIFLNGRRIKRRADASRRPEIDSPSLDG